MEYANVFSPIKVGSLELKNRFIIPSMGTAMATPMEGIPLPRLTDYWGARAEGGVALCIVEYAYVNQIGKGNFMQLGIYDDSLIEPLTQVVNKIVEHGAIPALQIHHAGRNAFARRNGNPFTVAPSRIADPFNQQIPNEMTLEEVYQTIEDYGDAAVRAQKAGFKAVEIHGAHGYLPGAFMSRNSNRRFDEFGGDLASRMKFPTLIIRNIKEKCGEDFTVGIRISGDERIPDGSTLPESCVMAKMLEDAGADWISVSVGTHSSQAYSIASPACPPGFNVYAAEAVKKSVSVPVIAVGRINTPELAEDIIRTGKADLIAIARETLADPEFVKKAAEGRTDEIAPCVSCLLRCQGQFPQSEERHAKDIHSGCMLNPFTGKEFDLRAEGKMDENYQLVPAEQSKKVVVVGGGPGGLEAAWVAARRGHEVTLLEKSAKLGGQYRAGSMAPYKQDIARAIKYLVTMCTKNGVNIKLETEATPDVLKAEAPDEIILATGGVPLIPPIEGIDGEHVVKAIDVLEGVVEAGKKCLVIGAGMVGVEVADYLATQLRDVTIVEMLDQIGIGENPGNTFFLIPRLKEGGVKMKTNCKVVSIGEEVVAEADGQEQSLGSFDTVVLALGSTSYNPLAEQLEGCGANVTAIGDAIKARRALEAIYEGAFAALEV